MKLLPFWVLKYRNYPDGRWCWATAIMEYSLNSSLTRFLGMAPSEFKFNGLTDNHAYYDLSTQHFPDEAIEVYQQEDMPTPNNHDRIVIKDVRKSDIMKHETIADSGLKKLPATLY